MANYDWPFGTLPLWTFFDQIWTQWTLRHILGPDLWSHSHLWMVEWMDILTFYLNHLSPLQGYF